MEIGELVASVTQVGKEDCWYCKEEKKKNGLVSNLERGDVAGLLNKVQKKSDLSWAQGDFGAVIPEAHHLIAVRPMADASNLHKYIKAGEKIEEDIGYDLNHPHNSVWLPGRPVPPEEKDTIDLINKSDAQIHNSGHPDYRSNISDMLGELYNKISKDEEQKKCPVCDAEMKNKQRPPYGLVHRLDALSKKMKELLTGSPKKWLLDEGYYTFSRALKDSAKTWISEGKL